MSITVDSRVAGLPKWAQQEMERLQQNADYWEARATVGPDDSDTFAFSSPRYTSLGQEPKPLGRGERIFFHLNEDRDLRSGGMVTAYVSRSGLLEVSVDDTLIVLPRAANSIQIASERR